MDYSLPGFSVHGILQARLLGFPYPRIKPRSPALQADSSPSEPPGKPWFKFLLNEPPKERPLARSEARTHVLSFWGSQTCRRGCAEAGPSTAAHRLIWIWPSPRLGRAAPSGCWETSFSAENIPTIPARGHQALLPLISCSDRVEKSAGHLPSQQVPDAHFLPSVLSEVSGHKHWPQPDRPTSRRPLSPPLHNSAGASPLGIVLHWPLAPRTGHFAMLSIWTKIYLRRSSGSRWRERSICDELSVCSSSVSQSVLGWSRELGSRTLQL